MLYLGISPCLLLWLKNIHLFIVLIFFYLQLVNQWTLIFGVKRQLDALREGFNSVLPLSNLTSFTYSEVRLVCCRLREVR